MRVAKRLFALSALLTVALLFVLPSQAASKKLSAVQNVDLNKYAGKWYEIGRLPNWFERDCASDVTAEYELTADKNVIVKNSCTQKDGKIKIANGFAKTANDSEVTLRVTFAPKALRFLAFVWADYTVISLDKDYQHVLVGEPSRKYLWILSRSKKLDSTTYDALVEKAKTEGFDVSKFIKTPQQAG